MAERTSLCNAQTVCRFFIVSQVARPGGAYGFSVTVLDSDSDGTQPAWQKKAFLLTLHFNRRCLGGDGFYLRAINRD